MIEYRASPMQAMQMQADKCVNVSLSKISRHQDI